MAETESQKIKRGVESDEGLGPRNYRITIPEEGFDPASQHETFVSVEDQMPVDTVPEAPPEALKVMSKETKNSLAVEAAAIDEYITKEDHFKLLDKALKTMDVKATLFESANFKVDKDVAEVEEEFVNHEFINPEEMRASGIATIDRQNDANKERMNPHLAYVRAIARDPKGGVTLARKANELKLMEMINEIADNMDWKDKASAFGGLLVPGNTLKDAFDMSGSAFSGETFVRNLVLNYKKATFEEQAEMLPVIQQELFDTLDNPFKVTAVLNSMLKPGGEHDLEIFSNLWAGLEFAELASLGLGLATRAANLAKHLNAAKVANELGNTERATKVTTASVLDPEMAKVNGLDPVEVTNIASPFNLGNIDPAYTVGLSSKVKDDLNTFIKQADNLEENLKGSDFFLREGLLDQADRAKAEKSFVENLPGIDDVENVKVVSRTGTSTTFSMRVGDKLVEQRLELTLDDVGNYENRVTTLMDDFIFSPDVTARGELKLATAAAQRQDQAQARVYNALIGFQQKALKDILGPLGLKGLTPGGRKRLAELDHVLKVGDARREVYTTEELLAGVDGVKLNDKQAGAYLKMRKLIDTMHTSRNGEMRNEMVVRGNKNIHITDDITEIGKPFADFQSAVVSLAKTRPLEVFDQSTRQGIVLSKVNLEAEYAAGRQLVRLREASGFQSADSRWSYALVNAEDISTLPAQVINYRKGYVPKINTNAQYFVKEFKATKVDGIAHASSSSKAQASTVRVFDTRKEAELFAAEIEAQARVNGDATTVFRALEDRQLEKEARALGAGFDESHSLGGSLYTGARKDEELLFGREGLPMETLGSFEAIGRNLTNLARFIPRNEWRMGLEQKAINTANHILPQNQSVTKFSQLAQLPDTQQGRYLKWLSNQIEDWMGFPTKGEQIWQNTVQRMYESNLIQKAPDFAKKTVQYVKHKDPIANARAAAFHSLLGWFNPIQLWVQAQGAAVAISHNILNPVAMGVVIRDGMALAASRYAQNPESIAHVAKAFGMKADDLMEMNRTWIKSGLEDSILMTADHAAAMRGHNVAMDALARTSNQGLYFYRKGEMFNRRTSFMTAYREFQKKNPGTTSIDDNALKTIMKRTNDFMLNLGRANRASFQKGAFGVTTQFLQVSTKTMETLLGLNKNFTAADRAKIFTTQLLLYGGAGMGISSLGSRTAAGMLGYDTQPKIENDMSPAMRKSLNEGFLGWATLTMFNVDADIGKRSSLLSGVSEFTDRMLFDDTPFVEMALGAFGSTGNRFWDAMSSTLRPIMYGEASVLDIDPIMTGRRFLTTLSSWNNVEKAMYMHNLNALVSRRGKVIRRRDFTAMEEFATAAGFSLSEEKQFYELNNILKAKQQFEAKIVDEIVFQMSQFALKAEAGELDEAKIKEVSENIAHLYQIMPTTAERLDLRDSVKARLTSGKGKDEFTKVWNRFIKEFNDGRVADLSDMHTKFTSYGIQQKIKGGGE